jgi:hypothetical protein
MNLVVFHSPLQSKNHQFMKRIFSLFSGAVILLAVACGGAEQKDNGHEGMSQNAAAEAKSPTDSLFDEVVGLHDEAMPKMGKLKGYADLAKLKIDSLGKLSDSKSKALKAEFEKLLAGLDLAQKGMNDWMDGFQHDKYADADSLKTYYMGEKAKAQAMRDDIFAVLGSAAAKFGDQSFQ